MKVSDEYVLLIQIQGNRYCHGVEWIKEGSQSHAQYWKDTKENQLIKKLSFFQFEDESNIFPNVCLQESINIRNAKEGACIYNKYGDRFLYQYNKIKDGVSVSDVIEAIVEKIGAILGKELPHSPRKYTSNY